MSESLVLRRSFYSPALNAEKNYCIYLPPSYRHRHELRYSVVYLLPGLFDYDMTWTEKGRVHEHMDDLIYNGKIGEMIIVMPDKDNVIFESRTQHLFTAYFIRDVIGHIDYEFRTIPARSHRGIEGLSMGGSWAVRLAVHYPELFSSVGSLSGGFDGTIYRILKEKHQYFHQLGMRFRLGAGSWEPESLAINEPFVRFLREQGFYCEFEVSEGPHDWPLWNIKYTTHSSFTIIHLIPYVCRKWVKHSGWKINQIASIMATIATRQFQGQFPSMGLPFKQIERREYHETRGS